jgi:hypothetical protein
MKNAIRLHTGTFFSTADHVRSFGTSTLNFFMATAAVESGNHVSWCGMRDRVRNMVRRRDGGGAEIAWRGWLRVYTAVEIVGSAVTKSLQEARVPVYR